MLKYVLLLLLSLTACMESTSTDINYPDEDPKQTLRVTCYDNHNNVISVIETHQVFLYGSKKKQKCLVEVVE